MKSWPVQEAKSRFSELLDRCLSEGPQMVTRRGAEAAVLVSVERWHHLLGRAKPSLKDVLLCDGARKENLVPERGAARRRKVEAM